MTKRFSLLSGLAYKLICKQLPLPTNRFKSPTQPSSDGRAMLQELTTANYFSKVILPLSKSPSLLERGFRGEAIIFQKQLLPNQFHLANKARYTLRPFHQTFCPWNYQWQLLFVLGLINFRQNKHQHYSDW